MVPTRKLVPKIRSSCGFSLSLQKTTMEEQNFRKSEQPSINSSLFASDRNFICVCSTYKSFQQTLVPHLLLSVAMEATVYIFDNVTSTNAWFLNTRIWMSKEQIKSQMWNAFQPQQQATDSTASAHRQLDSTVGIHLLGRFISLQIPRQLHPEAV